MSRRPSLFVHSATQTCPGRSPTCIYRKGDLHRSTEIATTKSTMDPVLDWVEWFRQDDSQNFQLRSQWADPVMTMPPTAETEPGSPVTPPPTYGDLGHRDPKHSFSIPQALDLLRQGQGTLYYVPSGYIPIVVPNGEPDFPGDVLGHHGPTRIPSDRLRTPPAKKPPAKKPPAKKPPAKKPPRPPNAFILYRKYKQV